MPIRRTAAESGVLRPPELDLLGRASSNSSSAVNLSKPTMPSASRIIANYMAGVRDEAELILLSRQPLGR